MKTLLQKAIQSPPYILVIGDFMVDRYIWGTCTRISPEAPVQVVNVTREHNKLGGACNVGANLRALGARVMMCGIIGHDEQGNWMLDELEHLGMDTACIMRTHRPTTQKSRILVGHQQVLRIDREDSQEINNEEELYALIVQHITEVNGVILSDYNKGLLTRTFTQRIITLAKQHKKIVLVDPKGHDYTKYKHATLLTPNKLEASQATKINICDEESLLKAMNIMQEQCSLDICLITLSEEGIAVLCDEKLQISPTIAKEVYDVTGAGDTVIAALAFGLSSGLDIMQASTFANAAAAVVIGKIGSASASMAEVTRLLHNDNGESKILTHEELVALLPSLRKKKIIFTNGCFDVLHRGHVSYLQKARALGDVLIIGLNSDASIKRLKGNMRPIISEDDRAALLGALECVDFVIIFDEDTPLELIRLICPDVLAKGADYKGKDIVGSDIAKEVVLIDFVPGQSTTNIIHKITTLNATKETL